jgi:hypothetical protein
MAIVQTQTTSFKAELYQGVHDLLTDDIFIALYTGNANLDASTTVYATANEITGTGYTAGGQQLLGATVSSSATAYVSFDSIQWNPAAFTTRCALIYNASKGNKSVAVLDFGSDKTATSAFTITMPANTPTTALIRSSY